MNSHLSLTIPTVTLLVCTTGVLAQDPQHLVFDVASIKQNVAGSASMRSTFQGRRFTANYVTLKALMGTAYGMPERPLADYQIAGGPAWIASDRFDLVATAPDVPDSSRGTFPEAVLAMLRSLLEERFHLRTHDETRELSQLALVLARSDGTLGPGLRRRSVECVSASSAAIGRDSVFGPTAALRRICGGRVGPGSLTATGATMTNLASGLARFVPGVDRVVVDRTGLAGTFDVDLTWNVETPAQLNDAQSPQNPGAPSLFTALREQLGLKLEAGKGPVNILVIDEVAPPTPD